MPSSPFPPHAPRRSLQWPDAQARGCMLGDFAPELRTLGPPGGVQAVLGSPPWLRPSHPLPPRPPPHTHVEGRGQVLRLLGGPRSFPQPRRSDKRHLLQLLLWKRDRSSLALANCAPDTLQLSRVPPQLPQDAPPPPHWPPMPLPPPTVAVVTTVAHLMSPALDLILPRSAETPFQGAPSFLHAKACPQGTGGDL